MERTPEGTPVGVDDPYAHADRCDHLTTDGRCRFALERAGDDPTFAADRRREEFACLAGDPDAEWRDCPQYCSTTDARECRRCGLPEVRLAHDDARPLLEEHHLSYGGGRDGREGETGGREGETGEREGGTGEGRSTADEDGAPSHEITVALCRWCHAKVHAGWARIDDDVNPDAEALATRETRRSTEQAELEFRTAAERDDRDR